MLNLEAGWKFLNLKVEPLWEARPGVSGISIGKERLLVFGNMKKDSRKNEKGTFYLNLKSKQASELAYISNDNLIANSYQTPFVVVKEEVLFLSYQQYPNLYHFNLKQTGPLRWKFEKL